MIWEVFSWLLTLYTFPSFGFTFEKLPIIYYTAVLLGWEWGKTNFCFEKFRVIADLIRNPAA
jgi:hypothetical protein